MKSFEQINFFICFLKFNSECKAICNWYSGPVVLAAASELGSIPGLHPRGEGGKHLLKGKETVSVRQRPEVLGSVV